VAQKQNRALDTEQSTTRFTVCANPGTIALGSQPEARIAVRSWIN
jgi:hypothetical protein